MTETESVFIFSSFLLLLFLDIRVRNGNDGMSVCKTRRSIDTSTICGRSNAMGHWRRFGRNTRCTDINTFTSGHSAVNGTISMFQFDTSAHSTEHTVIACATTHVCVCWCAVCVYGQTRVLMNESVIFIRVVYILSWAQLVAFIAQTHANTRRKKINCNRPFAFVLSFAAAAACCLFSVRLCACSYRMKTLIRPSRRW